MDALESKVAEVSLAPSASGDAEDDGEEEETALLDPGMYSPFSFAK